MLGNWGDCVVNGAPTLACLPPLIAAIVYWLLIAAGTVALFMIIFAGIKFINSGGDAKQVDSARKTLTYALIGLILVLMSFVIVSLIGTITGVNSLTDFKFGAQNAQNNPSSCASVGVCQSDSGICHQRAGKLDCGQGRVCCKD